VQQKREKKKVVPTEALNIKRHSAENPRGGRSQGKVRRIFKGEK